MDQLHAALFDLVDEHSDHGDEFVTARQVYYLAVAAGLVDKTDNGYRKVIRSLSWQREAGMLPWHWIADNARVRRQYASYSSALDALEQMQASYRRDYWQSQPYRVEVWVESDAIATAIERAVLRFGVPIYCCRGQSSKTFVKLAADDAVEIGKPIHVVYVGDWDPTGLAIDRSLEERYDRYSDGADLTVSRVAITATQIHDYDLPGGRAKTGDPNYQRFARSCERAFLPIMAVEAEALKPELLRSSVVDAVVDLVDADAWHMARAYEEAERAQLNALTLGGAS